MAFLKNDKQLNVFEIPHNTQMMTNFDAGKPWWSGLRKEHRQFIKRLLDKILIIKE
jgi:hypothetical protein